jgi:hypothetical protein
MLGHKIDWFGSPDLLYKKCSADPEFLQTSLKGFLVATKESVNNVVILDYDELSGVGARPL